MRSAPMGRSSKQTCTRRTVGGTVVDHRWSSSCRICSWAVPDQPPPRLSTRSGLWVNILISSSTTRDPQSPLELSKVERRGTMKRKAKARVRPHINVGSDFQAELPELQTRPPSDDEEPASLVWKPWEDDDSDMEKPDRVRELLDMAISRGIPRAAANLELALHCLHQAQGSVPGGPRHLKAIPCLIIITQTLIDGHLRRRSPSKRLFTPMARIFISFRSRFRVRPWHSVWSTTTPGKKNINLPALLLRLWANQRGGKALPERRMGRQGREAARGPAVLSVPVANHPSHPIRQEAPFRAGSANGYLKPLRKGTHIGEDIAHGRKQSLSPRRKDQISPGAVQGYQELAVKRTRWK
ncbi:uncharacterized protein [Aphelocoma coerulescens]|uniref:uncharacterized protein n=1 Tax=Aphelocoma coerulescens TaxID=39617 RepID=UPI003604F6A5